MSDRLVTERVLSDPRISDRVSRLTARAVRFVAAPLRRFARQDFVRQDRASASVEFALVATPFIALTLGVLQTALIFLSSQSLETAAAVAGRLIMTGQAQMQGWTAAQYKQQVCNHIQAIFNCSSGLYVDVESYSSFAAANLALPISNGSFVTSGLGYNPGVPGNVVVVRLYYQYPVFFTVLKLNNLTGNSNLLAATAIFQNEPYSAS
jgi:Flp pilus assembly protein TadG